MTTDTRLAHQVEAAWTVAYYQWEQGRLPSPSCTDLVLIANEVLGQPSLGEEALDETADLLDHLDCKSTPLDEMALAMVEILTTARR